MSQLNESSHSPIWPPPAPIEAISPPPAPIVVISPPPAPSSLSSATIAPDLLYSWDFGFDSVEIVPETVFASIETEDDDVRSSDSLMTMPEQESLVTESEYDRWRANGGLFDDEIVSPLLTEVEAVRFPIYNYLMVDFGSTYDEWVDNGEVMPPPPSPPPPPIRRERTKLEEIKYLQLLSMVYPSAEKLIKFDKRAYQELVE